jgi:peroxiredoxin family protein
MVYALVGNIEGNIVHRYERERKFSRKYIEKKSDRKEKANHDMLIKNKKLIEKFRRYACIPRLNNLVSKRRRSRADWMEQGIVVSKEFQDQDEEGKMFRADFLGLVMEGKLDPRHPNAIIYHVSNFYLD